MKEYLKKNGIRVGILVFVVTALVLIGSAARGGEIGFIQNTTGIIEGPVKKVLSSTVNWFKTIFGYVFEYGNLEKENDELRAQLALAQDAARAGIEDSEHNAELRKNLGLREKSTEYLTESSKIVLWSSSNWSSSFVISKGETSGIELGDPVVTEYNVLVGQISELGANWATVSTMIDTDMSVGAFVGQTEISGMVVGEFGMMKKNLAKLTYLADGAVISEGDEVLTSGSGGAFPAGIVMGTVSEVVKDGEGNLRYGVVKPGCEYDQLVQVYIIKDFQVVE